MIYSYTHYTHDSEALRFSNVINGLLIASNIIIMGFDFHYHKEHYQHMAKKYNMPGYERAIKYAKFYLVGGTILLFAWIGIWIAFF
jgi:hypothetical protein